MRLRFIGANGSMGLRHGQVYRVALEPWRDGVRLLIPVVCPYTSDEAFWANWERGTAPPSLAATLPTISEENAP